jgi:hypothetical protein
MTLTLQQIVRLRRALLVMAFVVAAFFIYLFSFAPVARLCGATENTSFDDLPSVVRFIYTPQQELMEHHLLPYILWDTIARFDAWWIGSS